MIIRYLDPWGKAGWNTEPKGSLIYETLLFAAIQTLLLNPKAKASNPKP